MDNRLVYSPVGMLLMLFLAFLLFMVVGFLFLDLARTAFTKIGFTWSQALFVLLASLLGSSINIPLTDMQCSAPMVRERYVRVFGIPYRVPVVERHELRHTAGHQRGWGRDSVSDLHRAHLQIPCIIIVCSGSNRFRRHPDQPGGETRAGSGNRHSCSSSALECGSGGDFAGLCRGAPHDLIFLIAYVGGTLGTLLGADILNLGKIRNLGAPVASIGGAGTFDGVFLSGLIAVLLV